jgi:hypothetical protein
LWCRNLIIYISFLLAMIAGAIALAAGSSRE